MENAVEALQMIFAMLTFVIAISLAVYILNVALSTSEVILYANDKTNYYDNIEIKEDTDGSRTEEQMTRRTVGLDTVIPTLYRYYKENFAVHIYDNSAPCNLVQIFDLTIEGKVRTANSTNMTGEQKALVSLYGTSNSRGGVRDEINPNLFGAPWMGNTSKDTKTRIDLYINGGCGYINNAIVDYRENNLQKLIAKASDGKVEFTEEFVEYAYKGDTFSLGEGEGIETITGTTKTENKILIVYRLK